MFSPVFSIFLVTVFLLVNINVVRQGSTSIIIRKNVNDTLELSIDIHLKHLYKSSTRLQLYFLEGCPIQTHIQKKMKIWSISLTTVATRINLLLFFFLKSKFKTLPMWYRIISSINTIESYAESNLMQKVNHSSLERTMYKR